MIFRLIMLCLKTTFSKEGGFLPKSLAITDTAPVIGDPRFANTGGLNPEDYIPSNAAVVKNRGIEIQKIPDNKIGLTIGLKVDVDFFGNPISGLPDFGAIEIK